MDVETLRLAEAEGVPNNPRLPVLIYTAALHKPPGDPAASAFETAFRTNGWGGIWRNGIFSFHHYHSRGHEVLGIAAGRARLVLGGPTGRELEVSAGDALVLPAGTGHCLLEADGDFLVVGAYPPGQEPDILREPPDDDARRRIDSLPLPASDPLAGPDGPLRRLWA